MRRLAIAAAVGAAVIGTAVPTLAAATSPAQSIPVYVWTTPDGSVCFVISEQVPHCVSTTPVTSILPGEYHVGPFTIDVSTANGGVAVGASQSGQPIVGATVSNGQLCVGISLEVPICVPLN